MPRATWCAVRWAAVIAFAVLAWLFREAPAAAQTSDDNRGITFGAAPAWASPADADGPMPESSPDAHQGRRYLLVDEQIRIDGPQVERYWHLSWQIHNEAGLQESSHVEVDFDPTSETVVLHALTIRRGGDVLDRLDHAGVRVAQREPNLDAQLYDGRKSAVLFVSDLRVGDIVEWSYSVRGADPTLGGKYVDTLPLGFPDPVDHLRARVLVPSTRQLQVSLHGPQNAATDLHPIERKGTTTTELVWDRHDVPAYTLEPDSPPGYDALPFVQLSEFSSWHDVATWGVRLFGAATSAPAPSIRAWVRDHASKDALSDDVLRDAIRFVQDDVRYVAIEVGMARRKPSDPGAVLARRYGDCKEKSALLVSILRAEGFNALVTLVSSSHGRELDTFAPSPGVFDHAIVRVAANGDVYWIDATVPLQGGHVARYRRSPFGYSLPLEEGTTALELADPPRASQPTLVIDDHFKAPAMSSRAEVELRSDRTYRGPWADALRAAMRSASSDELLRHYTSLYEKDFPGIHALGAPESSDDRDANQVRVSIRFGIPDFWSADGKGPSRRG